MVVRSVRIQAPWQCEVRPVELPALKPGWIRIGVEACGICGTDLTAAAAGATTWEPIGHEVAGRILELAPDVAGLQVGQAVVLESASFCGRCPSCRDGRVDLCTGKAPNFWGQASMGMADEFLVPACCAVPYEGLTPAEACLAEPCGVALDLVQTADIRLGQSVLVIGPGPIGLAAAALARNRGAARLVVVGTPRSKARLEIARELGAETVVSSDPAFADLAALDGAFDHVLNTAPTPAIAPSFRFLAYGGIETFIGIGTGDGTISFDANAFHFRKLQLRASFSSPAIAFPAVLRLMRAGVIPVRRLISHILPLDRAADAFAICRERKDEAVKVVVTP